MNILYGVGGLLLGLVMWVVGIYNRLVQLVNRTKEAWADIDVQLKRRHDLIPNLIETVKGYMNHERETLEAVVKARSNAMQGGGSTKQQMGAENSLTGTLKTLFAVAEAYPDLKANQNFLKLQDELADTENKIQAARRFYNANVRDLNIARQIFPNNMIVSMFNFESFDLFDLEATPEERKNIQVDFASDADAKDSE